MQTHKHVHSCICRFDQRRRDARRRAEHNSDYAQYLARRLALERQVETWGLVLDAVPADGFCFFVSVARWLRRLPSFAARIAAITAQVVPGDDNNIDQAIASWLRGEVVAEIVDNAENFAAFMPGMTRRVSD